MIMEQVEISKITLNVNGRLIELTADEARRIHTELDRLFNRTQTQQLDNPFNPYWPAPILIDRVPWPQKWDVICNNNTASVSINI